MEVPMRKLSFLLIALLLISPLFAGGSKEQSIVNEDGTVDIDFWYGAAVTEAGPIPEDWVGYDIIRDELGINLKLTVLPSSDQDQNVKVQAAGAGNNLPDVFLVQRPVLQNLVDQGLIAPLGEDFFAAMPTRTAKYHDADSINHATIDGTCWGMAVPAESNERGPRRRAGQPDPGRSRYARRRIRGYDLRRYADAAEGKNPAAAGPAQNQGYP